MQGRSSHAVLEAEEGFSVVEKFPGNVNQGWVYPAKKGIGCEIEDQRGQVARNENFMKVCAQVL